MSVCASQEWEKKIFGDDKDTLSRMQKDDASRVWRSQERIQNNSCQLRDGYKLLWNVMITSQPTFCPYKRYPEPQWQLLRDITTHTKRWILFFQFMGKSYQGYSSDTEQSLHFLRTIQEPAILSQVKSLEVSILNVNAQGPLKSKGRAPLPPHLCIDAMAQSNLLNRIYSTPPLPA